MPSADPTGVEQAMLAEARAEVQLADAKASLVLAGLGIGFGAILGGLLAGDWQPSDLKGFGEVLWWIGAVIIAAAISSSAAAVWPRYSKSDLSSGIRYWGHVSTFKSLSSYQAAAAASTVSNADRTSHQLWHLARLVSKKYLCVRFAIGLAGTGAVVLLIANALGSN